MQSTTPATNPPPASYTPLPWPSISICISLLVASHRSSTCLKLSRSVTPALSSKLAHTHPATRHQLNPAPKEAEGWPPPEVLDETSQNCYLDGTAIPINSALSFYREKTLAGGDESGEAQDKSATAHPKLRITKEKGKPRELRFVSGNQAVLYKQISLAVSQYDSAGVLCRAIVRPRYKMTFERHLSSQYGGILVEMDTLGNKELDMSTLHQYGI